MLEITDGMFYVLDAGDQKWVACTEKEIMQKLKEIGKGLKNPDDVAVLKVDTRKEKWNITQIPWSRIAIKLLGE